MSLRTALVLGLSLAVDAHAATGPANSQPAPQEEALPSVSGPTIRQPGAVVAIEGELVVIDLGDEPAVGVGTVLRAYRQLPGGHGSAEFRRSSPWYAVGDLTVEGIEGRVAVARRTAGPPRPLPAELDESGAPPDEIHIGDSVRTTGAVAARPRDVRISFDREALFAAGHHLPTDDGRTLLGRWLDTVDGLDGPVEIQVVVRVEGVRGAQDLERAASLAKDEPLGPLPGQKATPVEALWDDPHEPIAVPPGREVIVVQKDGKGARSWRYTDSFTLAEQQGRAVAEAVRARLDLPRETILVTVLPRPQSDPGPSVPGYDTGGDQVRILATGIRLKGEARPPAKAPKRAPANKGDRPVS